MQVVAVIHACHETIQALYGERFVNNTIVAITETSGGVFRIETIVSLKELLGSVTKESSTAIAMHLSMMATIDEEGEVEIVGLRTHNDTRYSG